MIERMSFIRLQANKSVYLNKKNACDLELIYRSVQIENLCRVMSVLLKYHLDCS